MVSAKLKQHVEKQARLLFPDGMYDEACEAIPRCGQMLVPRYTVRHIANHLRNFTSTEELRSFLHKKANQHERILIAWAFVRIAETVEHSSGSARLPSSIRTERLLHLDSLGLCQLGFWLHLIAWPEFHCPSYRDAHCGKCTLEPAV